MNGRFVQTLVLNLLLVLAYSNRVNGQAVDTYGPPKVEKNPVYLDSFVPAAMQVIAHITDLMKYEPTIGTTVAPALATLPHRPGIYAPSVPPSPPQSWTTRNPWWKLGELRYPDIGGYFSRYRHGWSLSLEPTTEKPQFRNQIQGNAIEDLDLLGILTSNLYQKVNIIDDFDENVDVFNQVEKFSDDYDDNASSLLRKKRPPPPRAYVTLLSLYDGLNKEAKKLALNKYAGYSKRTLEELEKFSKGTSANQLHRTLAKVVERRDITQAQIVKKMTTMIEDLKKPGSYINDALKDIPPLEYDIHF